MHFNYELNHKLSEIVVHNQQSLFFSVSVPSRFADGEELQSTLDTNETEVFSVFKTMQFPICPQRIVLYLKIPFQTK